MDVAGVWISMVTDGGSRQRVFDLGRTIGINWMENRISWQAWPPNIPALLRPTLILTRADAYAMDQERGVLRHLHRPHSASQHMLRWNSAVVTAKLTCTTLDSPGANAASLHDCDVRERLQVFHNGDGHCQTRWRKRTPGFHRAHIRLSERRQTTIQPRSAAGVAFSASNGSETMRGQT